MNGSYMKRSHARTLQLSSELSGYVLYTVLYAEFIYIIKTNFMKKQKTIELRSAVRKRRKLSKQLFNKMAWQPLLLTRLFPIDMAKNVKQISQHPGNIQWVSVDFQSKDEKWINIGTKENPHLCRQTDLSERDLIIYAKNIKMNHPDFGI